MEYIKTRPPKVMYFIQYFDDITLSWKETRKTYKTAEDAIKAGKKLKGEVRLVTYTDGNREYKNI